MTFFSPVAESNQPLPVMTQVIADLFLSTRSDLGNAFVGAMHERFELQKVKRLEQEQFCDRVAEMPVRLLE